MAWSAKVIWYIARVTCSAASTRPSRLYKPPRRGPGGRQRPTFSSSPEKNTRLPSPQSRSQTARVATHGHQRSAPSEQPVSAETAPRMAPPSPRHRTPTPSGAAHAVCIAYRAGEYRWLTARFPATWLTIAAEESCPTQRRQRRGERITPRDISAHRAETATATITASVEVARVTCGCRWKQVRSVVQDMLCKRDS